MTRAGKRCVQERYAPECACFGCGPANAKGLRIRSFPTGGPNGELEAEWRAESHHEAFPGMLNGGITGALLDCHSNWTAACHLMERRGADSPPCTVTSEFSVRLLRPTPIGALIRLTASVSEATDDRAEVEAVLSAEGKIRAKCRGVFVAVKAGHPAFHRW